MSSPSRFARCISHGSRSLRTIFTSSTCPTGLTSLSSAAGHLGAVSHLRADHERRVGIR